MGTAERIKLEKREASGKQACRKIRNEGKIPGVLYGPGVDGAIPFQVASASILPLANSGRWETARLEVDVPGGKKASCLMRDLQRDPLTGKVLHVDLFQLKKGHKIMVLSLIHISEPTRPY